MQTLYFWSRPIVFALFWILVAALTLSELTTLSPALQTAGGPSVRARAAARPPSGACSQTERRLAVVR
jgi:hypothetical protein